MWQKIHSEIVENTCIQFKCIIFSSEESLKSDDKMFVSMIKEIISNVVEEIQKKKTHCNSKEITKIENPYSAMFSEEIGKTMTL